MTVSVTFHFLGLAACTQSTNVACCYRRYA